MLAQMNLILRLLSFPFLRLLALPLLLYFCNANAQQVGNTVQGELILMLKPNEDLNNFLKTHSYLKVKKTVGKDWNIYELHYDSQHGNLAAILKKLQLSTAVQYVQANHYIELRQQPNDPKYELWHWNLDSLDAPTAWNYSTGGTTAKGDQIVVAVIDQGYDVAHEDMANNIWKNNGEIPDDQIDNDQNGYVDDYLGWNFTSSRGVHNQSAHGTSVASIIGAEGNNGVGMTGINWEVKLMCLSGSGVTMIRESSIIEAYAYIWEQRKRYRLSAGAQGAYVVVTNASLGVDYANAEDYPIWCAIYDSLGREGILSVAATINKAVNVDEQGDMPTTCASEFLISVTQSTPENQLHSSSGYGATHIDIAAPGAVYAARPNDTYNTFSGTSGAAPHVTGAVALMYAYPNAKFADLLETDPTAAARLIKNIVLETVDLFPSYQGKTVSQGRLNIGKAMARLENYFSPPTETSLEGLFPNPAQTIAFAKLNLAEVGTYQLQVYTVQGQSLYEEEWTIEKPTAIYKALNLNEWARGTYIVRLSHGKKCWATRLVK